MAEENEQMQRTDVADIKAKEQAPESRKRSRNADIAPRSEQYLSACSSSGLDRIFEMIVSESAAQYTTGFYALVPHMHAESRTTIPTAPAVAIAPQVQPTVPATVTPTVAAIQPLADPITTMMARFPDRNTADVSGRGFKGVAMSRGQIRAHLEIEDRTLATLPSSANSNDRHEMRGVAPPRTVDPTLINCVTTAQEILTFLPYQTVNYELWDRIRKS
ncbi:hypothetical protein G6011_00293 [Alternaria panax]|uniref:Uncharacterized protein n=1 Tax=Alternaria panax TaxID=48097 RepID=A0AAD4NUV6_9PLEO|nr:hypothetical protein G6011_00293 [Alternaria panax]